MQSFSIKYFGGKNTASPKDTLKPHEATDLRNVRLTSESLQKRLGHTEVGSGLDAATTIREMASAAGYLLAFQGIKSWKRTTGAFSNLGLPINATALPKILEFPALAAATSDTGIVTAVSSNGYGITADAEAYTVNQYVGYYCKITSGDANGEIRMITANTATELFFAEPNKAVVAVTNTFSIYAMVDNGVYFFDGVGTSQKNLDNLATTGWTALPSGIKLEIVAIYKNRIVGVETGSSKLYVSSLYNGEDFPYEFEVGKGNDSKITAISVVGDQLVIHKGMEGGVWITEGDSPVDWVFTQRAEDFGALNDESVAVGENIHFFVSERGIEWFNPLETNLMEGHKSLSSYRIPELKIGNYALDTAKGLTFDSKFYCAVKDASDPNLTNNRIFIFDIGIYLQRKIEGKISKDLPFLIDSGYKAESMVIYDGQIYFGGAGKVLEYSGGTDDGSAISSYWTKDGVDLGAPERNKSLRQVNVLSSGGSSSARIDIEDETDFQTKDLQQTALDSDAKTVNGKRTRGKNHKITLTLSSILTASIEKINFLFEIGKL